jgi:hypothetical protein
MKSFLIIALISLAIGFSISKMFFPSEKAAIKSTSIKKNIVISESKPIKIISDKKDEKTEVTKSIMKTLIVFPKDPQGRDLAFERIEGLIKSNPKDSFLAIKNLVDNGILDQDPILKGNLLVQAAFIKGNEPQVREMALTAIFSENIPKEKDGNELRTEEEINKEYSDDPKVIGIAQYYDAFLATTINDENQIFNKTMEIIENQPNIKVQRLVAKKYLETFPNNGPVFWELLKNRNIRLIPPGGKITIKGIIYQ